MAEPIGPITVPLPVPPTCEDAGSHIAEPPIHGTDGATRHRTAQPVGPSGNPLWQSGRCNGAGRDVTGRTVDPTRPAAMLQAITSRTGSVSLLIRKVRVRLLPGAPNPQVRGHRGENPPPLHCYRRHGREAEAVACRPLSADCRLAWSPARGRSARAGVLSKTFLPMASGPGRGGQPRAAHVSHLPLTWCPTPIN
jgi:hypothetical protein